LTNKAVEYAISTHATHKGGDALEVPEIMDVLLFQLTPPIRAATLPLPCGSSPLLISTHATHKGGDRILEGDTVRFYGISTHATHKGGDAGGGVLEATGYIISTHATHKGGD